MYFVIKVKVEVVDEASESSCDSNIMLSILRTHFCLLLFSFLYCFSSLDSGIPLKEWSSVGPSQMGSEVGVGVSSTGIIV